MASQSFVQVGCARKICGPKQNIRVILRNCGPVSLGLSGGAWRGGVCPNSGPRMNSKSEATLPGTAGCLWSGGDGHGSRGGLMCGGAGTLVR
jgi:hypothetical protein